MKHRLLSLFSKEHRAIPLVSGMIITLILGYALGATIHQKKVIVREGTPDNPAAVSSVNLMIDYGNGIVRAWNTVSWRESMSVLDLVQTVGQAEGIDVATEELDGKKRIRSIDGIANTAGSRWKYWINNTYEPRIASKSYLRPGDLVIYVYAKE